jgi:hypothetical protein
MYVVWNEEISTNVDHGGWSDEIRVWEIPMFCLLIFIFFVHLLIMNKCEGSIASKAWWSCNKTSTQWRWTLWVCGALWACFFSIFGNINMCKGCGYLLIYEMHHKSLVSDWGWWKIITRTWTWTC